jgi:hypothetical protein
MSPLPVERDLPTGRHAQLRDRLFAEISGGADRRRPRWLAPVAAAATAVGVLGVAVTVSGAVDNAHPSETVAPAEPRSSQQTTPSTTIAKPIVAGLTPALSEEIARGCAQSYGLPGDGSSLTSGPTATRMPEAGPDLALYNLIEDEAGKLGLIYGASVGLLCTIDGPAMKYNPSGGTARPHELSGAFDVDHQEAASGGDMPGNKPIYRGRLGYRAAAGRVSAEVTRVTVAADGRTVEATVRNGTFIGRLVYPSTWEASALTHPIVVRAYGADGRELPTEGTKSTWP